MKKITWFAFLGLCLFAWTGANNVVCVFGAMFIRLDRSGVCRKYQDRFDVSPYRRLDKRRQGHGTHCQLIG